jgi:tetratricopeptide (TPR) repeat protein
MIPGDTPQGSIAGEVRAVCSTPSLVFELFAMQTKGLLVCLILMLPNAGSVGGPTAPRKAHQRPIGPASTVSPQLQSLYEQTKSLIASGEYLKAARLNHQGYLDATQQGHPHFALRFLNNEGGCWFALSKYRQAMNTYLEARGLAERFGFRDIASGLSLNISSIYLQMGEVEGATEAVREGLAALAGAPHSKYRIQLLMQAGKVKAWQGDIDGAEPLFGEAIDEADRRGDVRLRAQACSLLGYALLRGGRVDAAEPRLLSHDKDIDHSYRTVGLLRMAQGDLTSARTLFDRAVVMAASKPGPAPRWNAHYWRGKVRLAQGDLTGALSDFRTALDLARRWRLEAIPADAVRVSLEVELQQLYSGFIQAANRLYLVNHNPALVSESFEAAEENRAASLRALITKRGDSHRGLPEEYGQLLARLRSIEISLLAKESPAARRQASHIHYALMQMEAKAGLESPVEALRQHSSNLASRVRRALDPDEALVSFHLGEPESYRWTLTREGIDLDQLDGRRQIAAQALRFLSSVRTGSPEAPRLGAALYATLFSGLPPTALAKPHWSLALDDVLFSVPLAALVVEPDAERPTYLIERHALRLVPSAHLIAARLETPPVPFPHGTFIGLGDPVYNLADPRARAVAASTARSSGLDLPRLVGSGQEIRRCASMWDPGAHPLLLTGATATREALAKALASSPAILHLAVHVIARPQDPVQGLVALSLSPVGQPEFLSAADIAAWHTHAGLVVLSGCGSGLGRVLPGAGLMGLTRAWLAAGAEAVAASLWPTPDDNGELFLSFYRRLRERGEVATSRFPAAAVALASAQTDMIGSRSWRAEPEYWAGYFLIAKE